MAMATKGFLGIDAGTQGLSVVFADESMNVIATGDGGYSMIPGLGEGCYEQHPSDWMAALETAMEDLRSKLPDEMEVLAIGISGQMHGEVLLDAKGDCPGPARLWCDARNEDEGKELTELLGVKMPKRITAARWLWTTRNSIDKARQTARITTPAGWLAFKLTGQFNLGIGDASGMFPIDQSNLDYDTKRLTQFEECVDSGPTKLGDLLPVVRKAGEDGGVLNAAGSKWLGLPQGIPVAPAEGDQPAALAGSLIAAPGMVSVSFGTSVCTNAVGDRPFTGVSDAIDHFCAVDGKPINMVFLRNGTTFMNTVVEMFARESASSFGDLMKRVLDAAPDCGGLMAVPFMEDEPGLGIGKGGQSMLWNLNPSNSTAANAIRAALTATMMNLKIGMDILNDQGYRQTKLILTGGLTKTPELGQLLADVTETRVTLPSGADEGTAVGAALLAKYRHEVINGSKEAWSEFLNSLADGTGEAFEPGSSAEALAKYFLKYKSLIQRVTANQCTVAS